MKSQKENSIMIGNTNYMCSAYSKLFLNTRSSTHIYAINQTNRTNLTNDRPSQTKLSQRKHQDKFSRAKLPRKITSKGRNQNNQNIESKTVSLQNSRKRQQVPIKNRQDTSTYRKLQIQERQIKTEKPKLNIHEKSIESEKPFKQRPHYSQNLNSNIKHQNGLYKKLYTFCAQNSRSNAEKHSNQINIETEADKRAQLSTNTGYEYSMNSSTIVVKEEELKRFTHKFARQKIQFQQFSQQMKNQIAELKKANQILLSQRNELIYYLQAKEQEIQELTDKIQNQTLQILSAKITKDQKLKQSEEKCQKDQIKIAKLQSQLQQKSNRLQQIVFQLERRQRQIQKLQCDNQNSKYFLPLSNINHVLSINSSLSNQSPPRIPYEILEQLQYLRDQYNKFHLHQNQEKRLSQYLKIQNEHLERELQLQKLTTNTLRKQINQLRTQLQQNQFLLKSIRVPDSAFEKFQDSPFRRKQQTQQLKDEIIYLLQQNAELAHGKQTLQKSLKVSSEMILHLKQENGKLKQKCQNIPLQNYCGSKKEQFITVQHVKMIVQSMMKEQLELQQKLKSSSINHDNKIPVYNQNLQKKYQQGYQSIKQIQKRKQHSKTQKNETNEDFEYYQKKNRTQISFVDQFSSEIQEYKNYFGSERSNP